MADYLAGATLEQLTAPSGLSKQGVADRLRDLGVHVRTSAETHALRESQAVAEHGEMVRKTFLRTRSLEATASATGLARAVVNRAVAATVPDHEVLARAPRNSVKRYTDQELTYSLVEAAASRDSNLTTKGYREHVMASPVLPDGRSRPGPQAMLLRFDSWRGALAAAGLSANPHAGPPKQFEGASAAITSIVECWRDAGTPPSVAFYDQWQRGQPSHPSSALARRLLGGSWNVGLVQAWQVVHDTPLPTDDPDRITPDLDSSALSFSAYSRADENVAVTGSLELTLPNYLALERAVRSHARLQNAVADVLIGQGFEPISPNVTGPQFDIAFLVQGMLALVEIKSCTASNAELQLRLGLGQILRYAHQLEAKCVNVKPVLAVEIKPSIEWIELLSALGVGILCEPSLVEDVTRLVAEVTPSPDVLQT